MWANMIITIAAKKVVKHHGQQWLSNTTVTWRILADEHSCFWMQHDLTCMVAEKCSAARIGTRKSQLHRWRVLSTHALLQAVRLNHMGLSVTYEPALRQTVMNTVFP